MVFDDSILLALAGIKRTNAEAVAAAARLQAVNASTGGENLDVRRPGDWLSAFG
jgi:hypothetical protein